MIASPNIIAKPAPQIPKITPAIANISTIMQNVIIIDNLLYKFLIKECVFHAKSLRDFDHFDLCLSNFSSY